MNNQQMVLLNYESELKNLNTLIQNLKEENNRLRIELKENEMSKKNEVEANENDVINQDKVMEIIQENETLAGRLEEALIQAEDQKMKNLRELEKRVKYPKIFFENFFKEQK